VPSGSKAPTKTVPRLRRARSITELQTISRDENIAGLEAQIVAKKASLAELEAALEQQAKAEAQKAAEQAALAELERAAAEALQKVAIAKAKMAALPA
jgi:hypothetical protein